MNKIDNKTLVKEIKRLNSDKKFLNIDLPSLINYYVSDDNKLKIAFTKLEQIKSNNMQEDNSCFEGWAFALYTYYLKKNGTVILDVDFNFDHDEIHILKNQHYGRFLYRALRFSEQYSAWFSLGEKLTYAINKFKNYLESNTFTNNFPDRECTPSDEYSAGKQRIKKLERSIEEKFADTEKGNAELRKLLGLKNEEKIYRQLPAGLFEKEKRKDMRVFPGNASAIDLWTISGDSFYPLELKAKNRMVGAITEIFFYSNYAYDMFINSSKDNSPFYLNKKVKSKRGYGEIVEKSESLKSVKGYLLLDESSVHPFFTKEVFDVMNTVTASDSNYHAPQITYDLIKY